RFDNAASIAPHKFGRTVLDVFRSLRYVAQHQNRNAKTGRFLLDATGIRQNEKCAFQEMNERDVVQGFGETYVWRVQDSVNRTSNVRIRVHWKDHHNPVRINLCKVSQRPTNVFQLFAETLTTVGGHQ